MIKEPPRLERQSRQRLTKPEKASPFRIAPYRRLIQIGFAAVTVWIGVEFYLFVQQLELGQIPSVSRPPGVEAFLPISALISLRHWLLSGDFNRVHPAGLVILLLILTTGVLLKKGFCSWVCPFGLLSEYLDKLSFKLFHRRVKLWRWLDYPLRSIKYLLAGFFLWAIFIEMDALMLERFIHSPYNRVADLKMLKFFTEMSSLTAWVLVSLTALSVLIPYFWCRYLCPYGALLGTLSFLSPFKIHRSAQTCIDCGKCAKICPALIKVDKIGSVWSDECHACLQCVDVCPVKETLCLSATPRRFKLPRWAYALIIVLLLVLGMQLAKFGGLWQNNITIPEYQRHIQHLNDPLYQHNRGNVPEPSNPRTLEPSNPKP